MDELYPKIKSVKSLDDYKLLVSFRNGVVKIYDCTPLLTIPVFHLLRNKAFFRAVQVGQGGYGIFWNDELDLSESELWIHGQTVEAVEDEVLSSLSDSKQA